MTRPRKIRRYGWIPDLPDQRDHLYAAPPAFLAALPPSTDLRSGCPAVYDQGRLGSCTANAIGGAIEFDRMKQKLPDFVPSRLFIYYNERVIEGTVSSDSGAQIRDGIKTVASQGVCPEPDWPYDITKFTQKPPANAWKTCCMNCRCRCRIERCSSSVQARPAACPRFFRFGNPEVKEPRQPWPRTW